MCKGLVGLAWKACPILATVHWLGFCHMLFLTVTGLGNVPTSQQSLCIWNGEHETLVSRQVLSTTLCSYYTSLIGVLWALPALCASTHAQPLLTLESTSPQTSPLLPAQLQFLLLPTNHSFTVSFPSTNIFCSLLHGRISFRQRGLKGKQKKTTSLLPWYRSQETNKKKN